jgi:hypothetical protein
MELIPRELVVGVLSPSLPGTTQVNRAKINRAWTEITSTYPYRQLEISPDETAAQFLGASVDDGVSIGLPLVQVRDLILLSAGQSARKAVSILRVIARELELQQFFNLGIKHIYNAPAPNHDGRGFVLADVLGKTDDDLAELSGGAEGIWGGIKLTIPLPEEEYGQPFYTLVIEPLLEDPSLLYIDLDAQFPGPLDLDAIEDRADDAETYLTQTVNRYLDRIQPGGG